MKWWLFCVAQLAFADLAPSIYGVYHSLDPRSISQHMAFYELYPTTELGQEALKVAGQLLGSDISTTLPFGSVYSLIAFVNRANDAPPILNESILEVVEGLAKHLPNRSLKGYGAWNKQELLSYPSDQLDLARALFLTEMKEDTPEQRLMIRSYEAYLDLMALQVLARLPTNATPQQKIRVINDYVFHEMRFRFPPHSLQVKEIDLYSVLPSVLDGRRGVCLGVSVLYLCLAQRLNLSLEAITPPGHIYVRYVDGKDVVNIETTARGIDLPSETYLSVETCALQKRSIREVVGLVSMNQASVTWHRKDIPGTIALYERAQEWLPNDYLITLFLGCNYILGGREKEGRELFIKLQQMFPDYTLSRDNVSVDYLEGKVDAKGIQAAYQEVDETRSSILAKQRELEETLKRCPEFRQGIIQLAVAHLQLGREKEAIPLLQRYLTLDSEDPTAHYYLSAIYAHRHDFPKAWTALEKAETIVHAQGHYPHALKALREELRRSCPPL